MSATITSSNPTTTDFGAAWFADLLYGGLNSGTLIFVKPVRGASREYFTRVATFDLSQSGSLQAAVDFARDHGADCYHKYNLFDGNAVAARGNAAIGGKAEVAGVVAFGLDLDVAWKDNKYLTQQQLVDVCSGMPVPPSVIVGSDGTSGGLHVYWAVQPVDVKAFPGGYNNLNGIACRWYRELARRIDALGGVIDATAGLERLLRFPGMLRSKSGQRVTVLGGSGIRHSLSELILEPDEVDAAEAKTHGTIRESSDSIIARGLDELGYELPDIVSWLGWTERTDGSGMVDRPESTSGSCTGIYACARDGRSGITIRSPGTIITLAIDPISGKPLTTAFPKITWLSRESFYVMATEGDISHDSYCRAAKKFACVANEDHFEPVATSGTTSREEYFRLAGGGKLPLANFAVVRNGNKKSNKPLSMSSIRQTLQQRWGSYPKSLNGASLLLPDEEHGARIMNKPSKLFAALHDDFDVNWKTGITKEEFFESLVSTQARLDDVEASPHFPPVESIEYTHGPIVHGDGSELDKWMQLWKPHSDVDRELILGLLVTVFWGGPPGKRPFFLIETAEDEKSKVGSGKSTLAEAVAMAANRGKPGYYTYRNSTDVNKFNSQLLCQSLESKRVVIFDNIKSLVVGGQDIESMVTQEAINGHRWYLGDGSRTNLLTWIGTGNHVRLSNDMAKRGFIIRIDPAVYTTDFERRLREIDYDRLAGDVASFFDRPKKSLDGKISRFGAWCGEVRSRLDDPGTIYETNLQRVKRLNDDEDSANAVRELLVDAMRGHYTGSFSEDGVRLFLPNRWLNNQLSGSDVAQGRSKIDSKYTNRILRQIVDKIPELEESKSLSQGRGWVWAGSAAPPTIDYQLKNWVH